MIPIAAIEPQIPDPLPEGSMPASEAISEEGFGGFRGTWFLGRVPIDEASRLVAEEDRLIAWLDEVAQTADEFEALAATIESSELADMSDELRNRAIDAELRSVMRAPDDMAPLDGLEVGVAGLTYTLSAIGCLTAASCRSHTSDRSWAAYPVVVFAAPAWRLKILAELIADARCGLDTDSVHGLLTIYGPSIRETHRLAELIVHERRRFRKRPEAPSAGVARRQAPPQGQQLSFLEGSPG